MCHSAQNEFDSSLSTSYQCLNSYALIEDDWLDRACVADISSETVGLNTETSLVSGQTFLLVKTSQGYNDIPTDGVAVRTRQGLAFSSLSYGHSTLLDNLKAQGVISYAAFSVFLSNQPDNEEMPGSSLTFGTWDTEKYAFSDFKYVNVTRGKGAWRVPQRAVFFGEMSLEDSHTTFISTSSPYINISSTAYDKIIGAVCHMVTCEHPTVYSTLFTCGNGEETELPKLIFTLGDHNLTLTYKQYVVKKGTECELMVSKRKTGVTVNTLGYPLLLAYYTVFDAEEYRIGFARSINNPRTSSSGWAVGVIVVVVLMGALIVGYYCWMRDRKPQQELTADLMEPLVRTND